MSLQLSVEGSLPFLLQEAKRRFMIGDGIFPKGMWRESRRIFLWVLGR